jgi:dimethylargininase
VELARRQHAGYCDWLRSVGLEVVVLEVNPDFPDSVFVEDTAVVVDEVAVMTTMGVGSRRGEIAAMENVLSRYRPIVRIADQGFAGADLEGGDVLRVGRRFFVGLSTRSNPAGAEALAAVLEPLGYSVTPVTVKGTLHLKSAVSAIDEKTLLINPPVLDTGPFEGFEWVRVPEDEPRAANILSVDGRIAVFSGYVKTARLLADLGLDVSSIDISELIKADSGLTCSSIIFDTGK